MNQKEFAEAVAASTGLHIPESLDAAVMAYLVKMQKDHDDTCEQLFSPTYTAVTDCRSMLNMRNIALVLARLDALERGCK